MNEQEEKELRDEIFQEEMMREELRKLSSEDLVHIDSIITGLSNLKGSKSISSSMWVMLLMWLLDIPMSEFNSTVISNKEEDEADKE